MAAAFYSKVNVCSQDVSGTKIVRLSFIAEDPFRGGAESVDVILPPSVAFEMAGLIENAVGALDRVKATS